MKKRLRKKIFKNIKEMFIYSLAIELDVIKENRINKLLKKMVYLNNVYKNCKKGKNFKKK